MSTFSSIRRTLYLTQRAMGDVQAAKRGTLPRRYARRVTVRGLFRLLK